MPLKPPLDLVLRTITHRTLTTTEGQTQPTALPLIWTRAEFASIINALNKFSAATGCDSVTFFHLLEGGPFVDSYLPADVTLVTKLRSLSEIQLKDLIARLTGTPA